ncbi:uncharacterized protein LOC104911381 isoform X2 [Meleagris gallopavo]|uniref:uncharacterized protein LOC104911381 isoform X2 n=1 Tax=Meleagris gallopavo TaxID=9103 RepID=UPI000549BECA|nr:uncharacterized protein LOC104911381 isoform X2 [Meleagris gallopavo]
MNRPFGCSRLLARVEERTIYILHSWSKMPMWMLEWSRETGTDENDVSHDASNLPAQESFLRPLCYVRCSPVIISCDSCLQLHVYNDSKDHSEMCLLEVSTGASTQRNSDTLVHKSVTTENIISASHSWIIVIGYVCVVFLEQTYADIYLKKQRLNSGLIFKYGCDGTLGGCAVYSPILSVNTLEKQFVT